MITGALLAGLPWLIIGFSRKIKLVGICKAHCASLAGVPFYSSLINYWKLYMVQVNHPNPPEFNHSLCMLIKFACFLPSADFPFFKTKKNLTSLPHI